MKAVTFAVIFCIFFHTALALAPTRFQWNVIDYSWQNNDRFTALEQGFYIPESNLPSGIAIWKDKLFITVPRWKIGVPSSLNYINTTGPENQTLTPYPTWLDGFFPDNACCVPTNKTVISVFKPFIDRCDRLWVVDNGVSDMANSVRQLVDPAIVVFNLNNDELITRYVIPTDMLRGSSVLSSIEVDCESPCDDSFAYITDMGANAIIVYDFRHNKSWRIEHEYFNCDPQAGLYRVGGIDFFWSDGVSSASLGPRNKKGHRDLYFHPTSSTKLFKISTELLKKNNVSKDDIANGIQIVGDRGPNSQVTSAVYDPGLNVLFYTLISKSGLGCWYVGKPYETKSNPLIFQDCNLLEFPTDIEVDSEGNVWVLSDRQSRFLYDTMDFNDINFRVLKTPAKTLVKGTACGDGVKKENRKKLIKKGCQV